MNVRSLDIPILWKTARSRLKGKAASDLLNSAAPAVLRFGGALLQFGVTLLIARNLGAIRSGEFFFWSSIFRTSGKVSTFGLDRLTLASVPRMEHDPEALSGFVAPIRITVLLVTLAIAGLVAGYAFTIDSAFPRPGWWYLLPPICMAGVTFCMLNGDSMTGRGHPVLGIVYRHTLPTAAFLSILLAATSTLNPNQLLAAFSLSFFGAGFLALAGPGFRGSGLRFRLPSPNELKNHLTQGSPIFLCSVFTALNYIVPLTLLERTHSADQVAFLTTAYRISMLFEVLTTAVHSLSMPDLSLAAHARDHGRVRRVYRGAVTRGLLLLGPPMLASFLLGGTLMSIFGSEFRAAGSVLQVCLGFGLVSLVFGPATNLILMMGKTGKLASFSFARLAVTASLSVLLIPQAGPAGMAISLGVGLLVEKGLCLLRSRTSQ